MVLLLVGNAGIGFVMALDRGSQPRQRGRRAIVRSDSDVGKRRDLSCVLVSPDCRHRCEKMLPDLIQCDEFSSTDDNLEGCDLRAKRRVSVNVGMNGFVLEGFVWGTAAGLFNSRSG